MSTSMILKGAELRRTEHGVVTAHALTCAHSSPVLGTGVGHALEIIPGRFGTLNQSHFQDLAAIVL
jgi:hypothetical protein